MYGNFNSAGGFPVHNFPHSQNMHRYPPPRPMWRPGPPPDFANFPPHVPVPPPFPPPRYPMPLGAGWDPMRGPPPRGPPQPLRGFPPGPFTPRALPPGAVPPRGHPPRGPPPPRGFPSPRGFPATRGPAPANGFTPRVANPGENNYNGNGNNKSSGHLSSNKRKSEFTPQNKEKKQKVNKRELPENNAYSCTTCDRGFKSEDLYKEHVNSHEKCRVEGCGYTAHPKLVRMHFDCQHKTGLSKQIWQAQSKEEIEKWISDRKKNYPTEENMERKKLEREERLKKGLDNGNYGKFQGRGRGRRGRGRGRGGHQWSRTDSGNNDDFHTNNQSFEANELKTDEIPTVTQNSDDQKISGDIDAADEDEKVVEMPLVRVGPDLKIYRKAGATGESKHPKNMKSPRVKRQEDNPLKHVWHKANAPPTLLERLHSRDKRKDRNMLLQCVRYVLEKFNLKEDSQSGKTVAAADDGNVKDDSTSTDNSAVNVIADITDIKVKTDNTAATIIKDDVVDDVSPKEDLMKFFGHQDEPVVKSPMPAEKMDIPECAEDNDVVSPSIRIGVNLDPIDHDLFAAVASSSASESVIDAAPEHLVSIFDSDIA